MSGYSTQEKDCFAQAAAALAKAGYADQGGNIADFVPARPDHGSKESLYDTCEFDNQGIRGEKERYASIETLEMLDTPIDEPHFNRITELMTKVFKTPVSLITLVADPSRVWFKSKVGPFGACVDRDGSWCNYVLVPSTPEILITEDASRDTRFAHNPFVAGEPFIKFYAGAPLVGSRGERYGTLCIVDLKQRAFTAELYALLNNFAALAVEEIERNKPLYEIATGASVNDVMSNRHLDMSLTGAREGIILLDVREADWPISYANPAFEKSSGLDLDDLAGEDFWQLFECAGKSQMDLGKLIGRGDMFQLRFFSKLSNKWLNLRFMPATSDRLAPSKATGIPGWVPSVDAPAGTKLGLDVDSNKIVDIAKRDLMDVVDAKCFWFAMVTECSADGSEGMTESTADTSDAGRSAAKSGTDSTKSPAGSVISGFTSAFGEYSPPSALGKLVLGPLLGSGSFGKVYRGTHDNVAVAVKVIDCRGREQGITSCQLDEIKLSLKLDHPLVVKTLAHETSTEILGGKQISAAWMIQELCDLGQLTDAAERGWLRVKRHITAPPDMKIIIPTLVDLSEAMAYVHSKDIIHADLTGRNVLLASSESSQRGWVAKVCDFGLSRLTDKDDGIPTATLGTITHMPPELLSDHVLYPAADVYAAGIIAWEAYYGKKIYCGKNPPQIIMTVVNNTPLKWPEDAPEKFTALMNSTLSYKQQDRPLFSALAKSLGDLL